MIGIIVLIIFVCFPLFNFLLHKSIDSFLLRVFCSIIITVFIIWLFGYFCEQYLRDLPSEDARTICIGVEHPSSNLTQ